MNREAFIDTHPMYGCPVLTLPWCFFFTSSTHFDLNLLHQSFLSIEIPTCTLWRRPK